MIGIEEEEEKSELERGKEEIIRTARIYGKEKERQGIGWGGVS